jgi:hypothetical protein
MKGTTIVLALGCIAFSCLACGEASASEPPRHLRRMRIEVNERYGDFATIDIVELRLPQLK